MTHNESPATIISDIVLLFFTALLWMIAIPFAIIGILAFTVYDTIKDAVRASGFPDWFYGRRLK